MGRRGPPRKPTAQRVLEGNRGKRAIPQHEPKPHAPIDLPDPPDWLTAIAQKEWRRVGPELIRLGLLTIADVPNFAVYCQAYSDIVECRELIERDGRTTQTESGAVLQHPAVGQFNRACEILHKFSGSFGLSPAARASLGDVRPTDAPTIRRRERK